MSPATASDNPRELNVTLTHRQWEALRALRMPKTEEQWLALEEEEGPIDVLFGGSKGPGKSFKLCVFTYLYALEVIRFFELPQTTNVPHIGWIGRKVAQVFVGTTLDTWKTVIPKSCYELVAASEKHPRHILIDHRVAIDYGGLDSRADLERFNSAEYGFIGLDQAEETTKDDVSTLMASRRKRLYHPRLKRMLPLPFRGLLTANPRNCWLKTDFIDRPGPGRVFVPALHSDNPHLPKSYVRTLEAAFSHRPDLLRAYRDGDWSSLSGIDQVVLAEYIAAARVRYREQPYIKRVVSVDPARFGNDDSVILGLENCAIIAGVALPYSPSTQVSQKAAGMSTQLGDVPIVVEEPGLGGPIIDELQEMGKNVISYNPNGASDNPNRYVNLRAQLWDDVGKWFCTGVFDVQASGLLCLPEPEDENLLVIYQRVIDQLTWPTYTFHGAKVMIAPKDQIKAEHNDQSPDHGEAYAQGIWHLRYVEPGHYGGNYSERYSPVQQSRDYRQREHAPPSAMTC